MSASVIRPLCAGRCSHGRTIAVGQSAEGKFVAVVLAQHPTREVAWATFDHAPSREEQLCLLEGFQ